MSIGNGAWNTVGEHLLQINKKTYKMILQKDDAAISKHQISDRVSVKTKIILLLVLAYF